MDALLSMNSNTLNVDHVINIITARFLTEMWF